MEEIFEAGDVFIIEPGHTPITFAGSEFVVFTPPGRRSSRAP